MNDDHIGQNCVLCLILDDSLARDMGQLGGARPKMAASWSEAKVHFPWRLGPQQKTDFLKKIKTEVLSGLHCLL